MLSKDTPPKCTCTECLELPEHNVLELYRADKKKKEELLEQNIVLIKDIPSTFKFSAKQHIQKKCIHKQHCSY